jgi:DNA-binding MurR/RpiR family transcriptional regulator
MKRACKNNMKRLLYRKISVILILCLAVSFGISEPTLAKKAKKNGARVILFTASKDIKLNEICDEIVEVAYLSELETGTKISPQVSILILLDVLYSYYFANDSYFKAEKYRRTLDAIEIE